MKGIFSMFDYNSVDEQEILKNQDILKKGANSKFFNEIILRTESKQIKLSLWKRSKNRFKK